MDDGEPSTQLSYESKGDFKRRRRFLILTDTHWEGIKFAVWMLGLLLTGLAVSMLVYLVSPR